MSVFVAFLLVTLRALSLLQFDGNKSLLTTCICQSEVFFNCLSFVFCFISYACKQICITMV